MGWGNPRIAFFSEKDNGKVCMFYSKTARAKGLKPLDKNIQIWKTEAFKYVVRFVQKHLIQIRNLNSVLTYCMMM